MKAFLSTLLNPNWKSAGQNALKRFYGSASSMQPRYGSERLYRRISPVGDPNVSVLPILDQWIEEGKTADKVELQRIIKELTRFRRYKHALEVSKWMTDKRYIPMTSLDVAARMNLIFKVHGMEQVEEYFGNVHQRFKHHVLLTALLNCYAQEKSLEKAEATMQKLRDMGWAKTPLPYNIMMNLYYSMGRWEKVDGIMKEMDEKGLFHDRYTVGIRLSAYAAAGDSAGIDKIVEVIESNPKITLTWNTYGVIVEGYLKVGQLDKALAMMKKLEGKIPSSNNSKNKNSGYTYLLTNYAELGKKEEVYRIWDLFKQKEKKINNTGYMSMMGSLSKLDDIEGMEKIFEEWESRVLSYDFRVPDHLIEGYCRKGLPGKAEEVLERGIAKGGVPSTATWCYMAGGYLLDGQEPKAMEALNKAVSICPPDFNPSKDTLIKCVECLEKHGNVENAEELIKSFEDIRGFSPILREKLSYLIKYPSIAEAEQGGA
nr:pentatricopeptide repeat-containing protein At2g20710, mitochondrial-like [Ipomoea trifida]